MYFSLLKSGKVYINKSFQFNLILILLFVVVQANIFSQNKVDSLLNVLSKSEDKSEIFNLLAEATLEDSLELSFDYAHKALDFSILENNLQQQGLAYFNIAEVFSSQYQLDSAKHYYAPALEIFKQTNDRYNVSYTLNNLGWLANNYCEFGDAINYYTESLDYLDKEKYADDLSHVYVNIGNLYHQTGKYQTAIKYFNMAIAVSKSIKYSPILTYAYNGVGLAYKYLADYDSAIVYYKRMLEIDEKSGDEKRLAIDYSNIGALYYQWKQYEEAFDYFNYALEVHKKNGSKSNLSASLGNIGSVYREQGKFDKALECFMQALSIDSITGIELNKSIRYNNIGDVYFEMGEYKKALDYFNKSLTINKKLGQDQNVAITLHNIGEVYLKSRDFKKAKDYFEQGLLLAESLNANPTIIEYLNSLSELNEASGNYKQSLAYHIRYSDLKDSIFKEKNQIAMADMKTKYDIIKNEEQIFLLNEKNHLKDIRISAYKNSLIFITVGTVIILILFSALYFQFRQKKMAYKKLVEKNRIHIASYEKITGLDSIKSGNNNNKLPETAQQNIRTELEQQLTNNKLYLDNNLTVKKVAEKLKTNPHYLSEVINSCYSTNFTGLINEYRVVEACRMLAQPENKNITIEGIAQMSGFKTKSVFNNAFKSITGVTPSYYRKLSGKYPEA